MRYILFIIIFLMLYIFNAFAYKEQDIDLYNHSNQHGVIFKAEDKKSYYDEISFDVVNIGKCGKEQYKIVKNTAKKLRDEEQPFWIYKYCNSAEYKYNTKSIIKAYNSYRFDLNKRLINHQDYKMLDNIVSYLPVNIKQGSNYLYYLGMRNNILEWEEDNKTLYITLPIMFSGIITTMKLKNDNVIVKEIFLYDRPNGLPKQGYQDLFQK